MNKIDSREFTENDYLAFAGAIEHEGHKPRITEFEDGADGVDIILAYTVEENLTLEIDIYQGDSAVTYSRSFKSYEEGQELFEHLGEELEPLCIGEVIDHLSGFAFDLTF